VRDNPDEDRYEATVDITHHFESPARIAEVPVARLPPEVLPFVYPSRYCQSDRLHRLAAREFGHLRQGYWRVQAIRDWVAQRSAMGFEKACNEGNAQACFELVVMHQQKLAGLKNIVEEVIPLLDKACAGNVNDSCKTAQAYRVRKAQLDAQAGSGSAVGSGSAAGSATP